MRKLKLQVQISVDGYIAGTNGEMDWMTWTWGDDITAYIKVLTAPVDTILLGSKLAEGFIPHWTSAAENTETADEFTRKMAETPKVVFTKTLETSEWNATKLAKGALVAEVNALKNQPGGDMIVYGGGTFVSALIEAGLIDELHLFVNPAALGTGMKIFGNRTHIALHSAQSFDCGIVVLTYLPTQPA